MVTVNLFGTYRLEAGVKTFQLDVPARRTAGKAILEVLQNYPVLNKYWMTSAGELFPHVVVVLNGRDIYSLPDKLDTHLQVGDQLGFFPPLAGG
ncbi:MAG: ubiquitin-like small modifier protein 1 [Leptolinea sp.]